MLMTVPAQELVWIDPTSATGSDQSPLTDEQVRSWRTQGVCLVDGILPLDLIERVRADAHAFYPAPQSPEAAQISDFGSGDQFVFPATSDAMNEVTLHPRLLAATAQLLDTPIAGLRLSQSDLWVKYGKPPAGRTVAGDGLSGNQDHVYDNQDQRIHVDYPNHSLAHPREWDAPDAVEMIVYYDNVGETGGATAVVPRTGPGDRAYPWPIVGTPGVGDLRWLNDRESAEEYLRANAPDVAAWRSEVLYPREQHARFSPGSVLLYRHDTWHRGTPLVDGAMRVAHNLTFRREGADWISVLHPGWAWAMYRAGQRMEKIMGAASVDQRSVLGFPKPGHEYWTLETLAAVTARYLSFGFDPAPYAAALADKGGR